MTAHAHHRAASRPRGEGLRRRPPVGVIPAWKLQRLFFYRNETDPIERDRLYRQFTADELERIPPPDGAPFTLWISRVEASGWLIDWDCLSGARGEP